MATIKKKITNKDLSLLLGGRSLILVSNRGPVEFTALPNGQYEVQRGGGGLSSAMTAVASATKATWIAAAMTEGDRQLATKMVKIGVPEEAPEFDVRFLSIPEDIYAKYYNQISNPLLWFIYHYAWDLPLEPNISASVYKAWSDGYVEANRLFARAVMEEIRGTQDAIIMFQDYHLFLAAQFIREDFALSFVTNQPRATQPLLSHFTHIPWPGPDYLKILPFSMRSQIMRGMLSNDLVGLQSERCVTNFLLCCQELTDAEVDFAKRVVVQEGGATRVKAYPIALDWRLLAKESESEPVRKLEKRIEEANRGVQLIVRSDRCDPTKNIVRGFRSFELMLTKHPELKGRVKFLASLYPTRESIEKYVSYREEIERTAAEINDKHGTEDWEPIYLRLRDDYEESLAALKCYDVLLVNPINDGMNLVAKEGPFVNKKNGVLILSENAGAQVELGEASLVINPIDINETAAALYQALFMDDEEREQRAAKLKKAIVANDTAKWLYRQLVDLNEIRRRGTTARLSSRVT